MNQIRNTQIETNEYLYKASFAEFTINAENGYP